MDMGKLYPARPQVPRNQRTINMWSHVGVRGRLLLAFLGISAFAVVAAAAAMFSFLEVGEVLNRITQRRVPSALAYQDLSRQTERIVAATPELLTVTTMTQHAELSSRIVAEVARLNALLTDVGGSDIETAAHTSTGPLVALLTSNLFDFDELIAERVRVNDWKEELLRGVVETHKEIQRLLAPWTLVAEAKVGQWRQAIKDASLSADKRAAAGTELERSIPLLRSLQKVQFEASVINDMFQQAASTEDPGRLKILAFRIEKSLRDMQRLATTFDPKLRQLLVARLNELRGFVSGVSIPNARARELDLLTKAEGLLTKNSGLSRQLTEVVDRLVADAKQDIADANREALAVQTFSTGVLIVVVALSLMSSILIVWLYVGRNLIARLTALSASMLAIAGGNLKVRLPAGGTDEIGDMADSLTVFRDTAESRAELMGELQVKNRELKEAFEDLKRTTLAKQRMEGELKVAHEIQMSMLPLVFPPFPDRKEFTIFANLTPAREVGGDLYDFFFIDDDHLCITVGDVSGKGVPAALFMARTKTLLKSSATNDLSPASIVTHANEELSENNDSCMFVTLFLGILAVKTGHFAYTNAGHNPSYLKHPADGAVIRLDTLHGPVLGAMEGVTYQQDQLLLHPGDTLLMYTDGVSEAMDPDDNLYSEERLAAWFTAREDTTVEELVQDVVDEVKKFENGAVQADDITLMAINFNGRD